MGLVIPDAGRAMGVRFVGAKGSMKTIAAWRGMAFSDFKRGVCGAGLDPVGRGVDEFLGRFLRLPDEEQLRLGQRLLLVDMAGSTGHVLPMPVYYQGVGDALYTVAQRPIEVWRRSDPALGSAPIMGLNAIVNTGTYTGMALSAMGCRLTEASSLLTAPKAWAGRLLAAEKAHPEIRPAVQWLLSDMPKPGTSRWDAHVQSYLNKVNQIVLDASSRALYGADAPGVSWDEVVTRNLFVLFDFRHVFSEEQKIFGLLWVMRSIVEYLKKRGPGRRFPPFALYLEEFTYFLSSDYRQQDVLAGDIEELVARLSRNTRCWLVLIHQELNQLSRRMHNVMMSCGSHIFSSTSDLEGGAEVWAKRFDPYQPTKVKAYRPVWMHGDRYQGDYIVDYEPIYETIAEQIRSAAQTKYLDVGEPGVFWGSIAPKEGTLGGKPVRITIRNRVAGRWVDEDQVAQARAQLAARDGRALAEIDAEIAARLARPPDHKAMAVPVRPGAQPPSEPRPALADGPPPPPRKVVRQKLT